MRAKATLHWAQRLFFLTLNNLCVLFTDPLGGRLLPVYPQCNLESVQEKVGESKEKGRDTEQEAWRSWQQ